MKRVIRAMMRVISGDAGANRVVPPTGPAALLTLFTAAVMAFLAVFSLALSLATARLAERWSEALAQRATIQIIAPAEMMEVQTRQVLDILAVTPGIAAARALDMAETRALLAPWFGPELPVESLPIPQLIDVMETSEGADMQGLRLRLAAEVPEATLDDHLRWRRPLVEAASRMWFLSVLSLVLIGGAMTAMVTLAVQAALASNDQVIGVLRLVGARDAFINRAFVRRFTARALGGAVLGTLAGAVAVALLPGASPEGAFLSGLGFSGPEWFWLLAIPSLAAIIAFWATRTTALHRLRRLP